MKSTVKVAKIGNSRGIRLQKGLLERYKIDGELEMETTPDAIILRPLPDRTLDWEETYRQIAESDEDWSDWEGVSEDGLTHGD